MSDLTRYSDTCGHYGCSEPTHLVMMRVWSLSGKKLVGPGSEFMQLDAHNNVSFPAEMKPEYTFKSWITRCAECYLSGLDGTPKDRIHGTEANKKLALEGNNG